MGKIESMIHHKFELFSNYFVLFLDVFRSVCSLFLKFKFSAKGRSEVPEGLKQKPGWIVRVNPNLDYSQLDYPQLDYPHLD